MTETQASPKQQQKKEKKPEHPNVPLSADWLCVGHVYTWLA